MTMTALVAEAAADAARHRAMLLPPQELGSGLDGRSVVVEVHGWREPPGSVFLPPVLPGSVVTHVATDFAGEEAPGSGHLPLPDPERLSGRVRRLLRAARTRTLAVRPAPGSGLASATRAWLVLRLLGAPDVRVLGAAGMSGPAGAAAAEGRDEVLPPPLRTIGAEQAERVARRGTLLDARPRTAFEADGGNGHIPGARSAPVSTLLTPEGDLPQAAEIRRWLLRHRALGAHATAAYCGGGVQSSLVVFAAHLVGQPMGIYVDSWSGYVKRDHDGSQAGPAAAVPVEGCLG